MAGVIILVGITRSYPPDITCEITLVLMTLLALERMEEEEEYVPDDFARYSGTAESIVRCGS